MLHNARFRGLVSRARASSDFLKMIQPEDLLKYGMIPEFVGRILVIVTLRELDETDLMRVLTEQKNSLVKQFQQLSRSSALSFFSEI